MTYIIHYCEWAYGSGTKCNNPLTEKVYNFSMSRFHKGLCFGHQQRSVMPVEEGYASIKDYTESVS